MMTYAEQMSERPIEDVTRLLAQQTNQLLEDHTEVYWIPVDDLGVDTAYQRPPSAQKVKEISKEWHVIAAGTIIVNRRIDRTQVVIDGQHRWLAAKQCGRTQVRCLVAEGLTVEEEAKIYLYCNLLRKKPEALDVFRARLLTDDAVAHQITTIVEACGLRIDFYPTPSRKKNTLWAVVALEEIYRRGKQNPRFLRDILLMAKNAWPDESEALSARVLLGLMHFHLKYQGKYFHEEFLAKMKQTDLKNLFRRTSYHVENGMHSGMAFAKALQEAYDKGRRSRRLELAS